jgi:hypothetical protein
MAASAPLLPAACRPSLVIVSLANAVGFVQMEVWFALLAEAVLRRARPFPELPYGRLATWRYPSSSSLAWVLDALANSRFLRALLEPVPVLAARSDLTDAVYVNYLLPAESLAPLVPVGLRLQRLGPNGEHAIFTFLTFRHGHFGYALLGPLRRLMPSPVQTNWRIHVEDPASGLRGIYFLTNAVANATFAIGARVTTEAMPMHVLRHGDIERTPRGTLRVSLDPGSGSAPDADLDLSSTDAPMVLAGAWAACWPDFRAFLAYCVPQDRAMSSQPLRRQLTQQEIDLGIPLDACERLVGRVESRAATALVGDAQPLCFRVASVSFRFTREVHERRPELE